LVLDFSPNHAITHHFSSQALLPCPIMRLSWYYFFLIAIQRKQLSDEEWENRPYKRRHSRYQKAFYRALTAEEKQRRQRRIPRASLHTPRQCAWRYLYYSYNDQALITVTGLDHATFEYLLRLFQPIFDSTTPFGETTMKTNQRGRKRQVTAADCLGLVLAWTRTRGSTMSLQMHFGLSMTNLCLYLRFGRRIVASILSHDHYAKIGLPSNEQIQQYKAAIAEKYPLLGDVWSAMDGLKTPIQQSGSTKIQGYFYNGWKHNHFVTSVFCFCPDGTIPIAHMNLPGATHDSTIADWGDIYIKLESVYGRSGGICCVDSAFRMRNAPYIIKSSQNDMVGAGPTTLAQQIDLLRKQQATSMRQSSEWGMRMMQSSFPRLCDKFPYETRGERRISLKMMVLLYNLRARMVGINQIRNVFMPALVIDARTYLQ